jgi:hypothetical protein
VPFDHLYSRETLIELARTNSLTLEDINGVRRHGLYYAMDLDPVDMATLEKFVIDYNKGRPRGTPLLEFMPVDRYMLDVFYRKVPINQKRSVYSLKYIVGHNVLYDLGRLAVHTGLAREDLYGGLSMRLCTCISKAVQATGECTCAPLPKTDRFQCDNVGCKCDAVHTKDYFDNPIRIVDTLQVAKSLLGAGTPGSLRSLARLLKLKVQNATPAMIKHPSTSNTA